jgi:UDP-N-acetylglucosamine--N-acetylmuramyl-(pentapeptide) pyrophosphoryl-undecaprenol N-acetylglucosamine transferase
MHLNHEKLKSLAWPLLILSAVLLVLVLIPGVGTKVKGARRWIRIAGFGFQPSELARLALVIFLAYSLTVKQDLIKTFKHGFLPYLIVTGIIAALILLEPDMGGAVTVGLLMLVMLFVAGARYRHLVPTVMVAAVVMFIFLISDGLRWKRVLATIDPWSCWKDAGWQLVNSFLAFGSGGIYGKGLGQGMQKLFYVRRRCGGGDHFCAGGVSGGHHRMAVIEPVRGIPRIWNHRHDRSACGYQHDGGAGSVAYQGPGAALHKLRRVGPGGLPSGRGHIIKRFDQDVQDQVMERRIIIAGGKTGGHLFPGIAVAEELLSRDPDHRVLFVGTQHGIEARLVPEAGYEFVAIRSRGLARMGVTGKIKGIGILPLSIMDAIRVIRKWKPQVALGVGGYVSGPVILAAWLTGVPCAVQEQNAAPGITNRILGLFVRKVFLSFAQAGGWFERAANKGRVTVSGNPIRKKIVDALVDRSGKPRREDTGANGKARILVLGGSQGAHGLNLLFVEAVSGLPNNERQRLLIRHQSGGADRDMVEVRYRELGIEARVEPFIDEMASAYLEADLVVSRAGAGAVAEIALAGLPSILVPYPYAVSDHQAMNAQALVQAGAAYMFREGETNGKTMAGAIAMMVKDKKRLWEMSEGARSIGKPDAAAVIVDQCIEMISGTA